MVFFLPFPSFYLIFFFRFSFFVFLALVTDSICGEKQPKLRRVQSITGSLCGGAMRRGIRCGGAGRQTVRIVRER